MAEFRVSPWNFDINRLASTIRHNPTLAVRVTAVALAALGPSVALPACAESGRVTGMIPAATSQSGHRALHDCHFAGVPCGQQDRSAPGDDVRPDNRDPQAIESTREATPVNLVIFRSQSRLQAVPLSTVGPPIYARNCAYLE